MSGASAADPPARAAGILKLAARRTARRDRDAVAGFYRLKQIGIVIPAGFVIVIEAVRLLFVDGGAQESRWHLVLGVVMLVAIAVFGSVMFWYIDRVHRMVIRHNRELSAVNAVTVAIRGDLGVDQIIDAALHTLITTSGAVEGSVTAFAPEGRLPHEDGLTWHRSARTESRPGGCGPGGCGPGGSGSGGAEPDRTVEVPLLAGPARVGTLRLAWAGGANSVSRLSDGILRNISEQIGSSIQRAQLFADLRRGKQEGHALYDLLLRLSSQQSAADTLAAIVGCARQLLAADDAVLSLSVATARSIPLGTEISDPAGPVCVELDPARAGHKPACARRASGRFSATLSAPLRGPKGTMGTLWLGRRADHPFSGRDSAYLGTLAEFAVIAIGSARMLENERHGATLAERDRIAREMHDSLAQVLGVAHLRLRALGAVRDVCAAPGVRDEVADLAELCHEAYRDVREAILGLHESSRPHRALLESLRAYAEKFSRQSGIVTRLESDIDQELALAPRCEVQVIRVIQEALTNARKHSGARTAVIRAEAGPGGTTFVIEDDGKGFEVAAVPADGDSFGIVAMTERMRLVSGSLTIDSAPGRGIRVVASLPAAVGGFAAVAPVVPASPASVASGAARK